MTDEQLFRDLIVAARTLAVACDNAATILSAEFESMVTGPLGVLNDVLARCPDVLPWNGSFEESDITVEVYRNDAQRPDLPPVSVRVMHRPSNQTVESYSKMTKEENEAVARRALAVRVRDRWQEMHKPA